MLHDCEQELFVTVSMGWNAVQRARLASERSTLEQNFPGHVKWIDPEGTTKVEVAMHTNNGKRYSLRVYIPVDFPNSIPDMVVASSDDEMPDWEAGYETHSWGKTKYGLLQICHCRRSCWNDKRSLFEVFLKGRLWLEAYEACKQTKLPMCFFLKGMKKQEIWHRSRTVEFLAIFRQFDIHSFGWDLYIEDVINFQLN